MSVRKEWEWILNGYGVADKDEKDGGGGGGGDKFPGVLPQALGKDQIHEIRGRTLGPKRYCQYVSAPKADGTRMLMVWRDQTLLFFNRKRQMVQEMWNLTTNAPVVFDVELLDDGTVLIFDMVWVNHKPLMDRYTYPQRLQLAQAYLKRRGGSQYATDRWSLLGDHCWQLEGSGRIMRIKPIYHWFDAQHGLDQFPYPHDGVIFTPVHGPFPTYKWKPLDHITVDLQLQVFKDPFGTASSELVYDLMSTKNQRVGEIHVTQPLDPGIWECRPQVQGDHLEWVAVRPRPDKTKPNPMNIVRDTLTTLHEGVTLEDVMDGPV